MLGTAAIVRQRRPTATRSAISTAAPLSVSPVLYKKINYDPVKDFVPIYLYVKSPFVLVVDPALPIKSVPDLIKHAKASASPMTYSSPGAGALAASLDRVHGAAIRAEDDPCALSQLAAIDRRHRRRPCQSRLRRSRRIAAADPRRQAAGARSLLRDAAADGAGCAAVRRGRRLARVSKPCPGTCCSRRPPRRRTSSTGCTRRCGEIMSTPDMKKRAADIGLMPIDFAADRRHPPYITSEQEKWGSLVRKLGLEGTQ